MQLTYLTAFLYTFSVIAAAPPTIRDDNAISVRDSPLASLSGLEKRKGGGGGRGGGSSGGSSSGGRSGGGATNGVSSGGRTYSYSPSSNAGGSTRDGSGTPPAYGNRYAGGATVPYTAGAGAVSPTRRIAPYALPIAAVAFFPGLWLFPVFAYGYPIGYHWDENGRNRTSNVTCLCQEYSVCGCDPTDNSTFLSTVLSNGTGGAPVNSTIARTIDYSNGSTISYINGTLDNGTTASGGTDPSNDSEVSPATRLVINYAGYWIMIGTVVLGVTMV